MYSLLAYSVKILEKKIPALQSPPKMFSVSALGRIDGFKSYSHVFEFSALSFTYPGTQKETP